MIPVLYEKNSTTFTTQGLGPLPDIAECTVQEERNGVYELEFRYPVTGLHYENIEIGNVIRARNAYCGLQPFDIYAISRPINGIVTVNARHVSYRLNKKVLNPCSGSSAASTMAVIGAHIMDGSDFTFWTDKTTVADWSTTVPTSVRASLGGTDGSVLDVYGGEYEWDNFEVKLYASRGNDTGVTIKYGKNLLDIVADEDGGDLFTACVPYFTARNDAVTIAQVVKTAEWASDNDYTSVMDMNPYFEAPDGAAESWHPTTAQMEAKALALMNANAVSAITQNLTVKFALLSQSDEYANLAALERVKLCDTVTVTHPGLGIDAKLKVVATTWNVLLDRYDEIELGQPKATLSETIVKDLSEAFAALEAELDDKVDWTHMDEAIENATDLISGGDGGYVVLGRNADGEPNEIFIMDQPDITQAVSVIRLNKNGIGFSTQGINGPYTNAWTIDGHLVADFMDTGVLNATIIKAGTLADPNGNFILDLPTGTMTMKKGSINLGYHQQGNFYNFAVDDNGILETRYSNGNKAWQLNADELRIHSQGTADKEVGEISYRDFYVNASIGYKESLDIRFDTGCGMVVSEGLGSSQTTKFSIDSDGVRNWKPAYFYDGLELDQFVVSGSTVYEYKGYIGFQYGGALAITNRESGGRIELSAPGGVYVNGTRIG